MEKLRYRIIHCSGSDLQYPHTELIQITQDSKGWQSPRFCAYPQQLIIQFYSPVRLKQIQILSHEFKISSKIEVSVYIPDVKAPIPQQNPKYIKVGYMTLNSNEKSNYKQRELKSAYLDTAAVQLKLDFQKNYPNKQNVFNQIGILMLNFFGELLISDPYQRQSEVTGQDVIVTTNSLEKQKLKIDSITADRIKVLETAKDKAVMNEDYEVAKKLKNAIDKMKQIGILIYQLEEKKAVAVNSEDYESARLIQAELQMLKNAIQPELMFNKNPQGDLPTINKGYYDESKKQQMVDSIQEEEQDLDPEEYDENSRNKEQKEFVPFDERPLPALANKQKNNDQINEEGREQNSQQQKSKDLQQQENNEDEDQNNEIENAEQEEKIEASKLSQENEKIMETVSQVLPSENIIQIFSKKWQTREETLKSIEEELKAPKNLKGDQQIQFHAFLCIISYTIAQNIIPIYQTSLSLLNLTLQKFNAKITPKSEFPRYINTIQDNLLQKLAETNQRIKEQAENTLLDMCKHPSITPSVIVTHLIKAEKSSKSNSSHKNIAAKIDLLSKIVKSYKINNNEVPLNPVMEHLSKLVGHQNNDVRIKALDLFFDIYKIVGEAKFSPFVEVLLPNQKEIVENEISNLKSGGQGGTYKEVPKLDVKKVQGTFKKNMQLQQQQAKQKQEAFQQQKLEKQEKAAADAKNNKLNKKQSKIIDKKTTKKDSKKGTKIQEEENQQN